MVIHTSIINVNLQTKSLPPLWRVIIVILKLFLYPNLETLAEYSLTLESEPSFY